ncbi:MAG: PorT family protein [Mangrovimonas sp.]|nr:PorT family protein [Mangrovimonas sp.]
MKYLVISTCILILSTTSILAQNPSPNLNLGVKGGLNISTVGGDDIEERDSRTSFNAGLFAEVPLTDRFSFQPEVLYSGQGFDIMEIDQDNIFDTNENIEYQLDYIQFPLMAKAYLIKGLYVEAGPQFGFKINEEIDTAPNSDGGDTPIDPDDSYVKDFDFSGALGVGYKFDNGFFLSARYTHGFSSIFKEDTIFEDVDARNSVWQFGLGFSF